MLYFHLVQSIFFLNFPCSFLFDSWIIQSVLFTFQVFGDFVVIFQLLISNLISLWLKNTQSMILILLNLLTFVLWSRVQSILEYSPWALGKNVYSAIVECKIFINVLDPVGCAVGEFYIFGNFLCRGSTNQLLRNGQRILQLQLQIC